MQMRSLLFSLLASSFLALAVAKCQRQKTVSSGDTCWSLWTKNHLSDQQFYQLNPGINCNGLWIGQVVCVAGEDHKHDGDTDLVTFEQFKDAVISCGFPGPSRDQYEKCVTQAKHGLITSKRELAMFVAQIIHESAGLTQKIEAACRDSGCPGHYETPSDVPGKRYFGRGYMHLTWHYNYVAASQSLYRDQRLATDPDQVASNEEVAWATAFWFWKTNVHSAYGVSLGQFGATTKAINGHLECKKGEKSKSAQTRFKYYQKVLAKFDANERPVENGCYN